MFAAAPGANFNFRACSMQQVAGGVDASGLKRAN
jgi:hypothetical protein